MTTCDRRVLLAAAAAFLFAAAAPGPAAADEPDLPRERTPIGAAAVSAPAIDGVLAPGEWDDADRIEIHPEGEEPAVLYVKNDATSLYLALAVKDPTFADLDALLVVFDARLAEDEPGRQDAIGAATTQAGSEFFDLVQARIGVKPVLAIPGVGGWDLDTASGGSEDGAAAVANDGSSTVFELVHPLRSGDVHDVALGIGDRVGLAIRYQDPARGALLEWPDEIGATDVYAELSIAGLPSEVAFTSLRTLLETVPAEVFAGSKRAGKPPGAREERRRKKLLARLAKVEGLFADGRARAAARKLRRVVRRVAPMRRRAWLDHDLPVASQIQIAAGGLAELIEVLLPPSCQRPADEVANGVRTYFRDGFEEPNGWWTADGLWHRTTSAQLASASCRTGDACVRYGDDAQDSYETGTAANAGDLVSPSFHVPPGTHAVVSFSTWEETEDRFITWDRKRLEYSTDDGATWEESDPVYQGQASGSWRTAVADLRGAGGCVRLRFRFDTDDHKRNDFRGWIVDDVVVHASEADVEWQKVAPDNAPDAPFAPVLVGDGKAADAAGPGIGRLYAFSIDEDGHPYLAAHDMERGFEPWVRIPGGARLAPGSGSATSWNGRIVLAARGLRSPELYVTSFESVRAGRPAPWKFAALGSELIEGRPALAASSARFHVVARGAGTGVSRPLLHAQTASPTGSWSPLTPVGGAFLGPFDPAVASGTDDEIHVVWVDPSSQVFHVSRPEGGPFASPVFTNQAFAIASPAVVYYHDRVHTALQLPGTLQYKHTEPDGSWGALVSSASNESTAPPRLAGYFGQPVILTRGDVGPDQVVKFFRVDTNLPDEPIEHLGVLAAPDGEAFPTSVPVELASSFGELFAAAHGGSGSGTANYVWASRLLARRTFDTLGVTFQTTPFRECRGLPDGFPFRNGDVAVNAVGACPGGRLPYPPALGPPAGTDLWDHLGYTRLGLLFWSLPWRVWTDTQVASSFEVNLAGAGVVGRAGGGNARWFGLGYLDLGGYLEARLGAGARSVQAADGLVDQEFTHALYPIPGLEAAPGVFWKNEDQWDPNTPGNCIGAPCLCGGTRRQVASCPVPDKFAFASNYGRSSEDHDFIELWYRYRFLDANATRTRANSGTCCGLPWLSAKYAYIRDVLYEGQEFQEGRRCTPDTCPPPETCPVPDTSEWLALCTPD